MAYTKYSLTPANNTATPPDGAPEGMLPSAVNDTMRDMMAQIRDCGDGIRDGTYTMTAAKITGGTITGITDLAIADGGTGASTAAGARTNLGLDGFVNMKNRIINGAMVIDQRNAGASITPTNGQYSVDRWLCALTQASKYTVQQNAGSVTPPSGFVKYLGVTSSSAYSVVTGDFFGIQHRIEGFNVSDLDWGTANAKTVTLSFWVRSSLTGTHSGAISNAPVTRSYPFTFTVSSANTWEYKTVTIAGDTSGTWATDNSIGILLNFSLGMGSTYAASAGSWQAGNFGGATGAVSVVGTNGATFYITGVQLEVGSTATSFDYRPYGTELALCQRYYEKTYPTNTALGNTSSGCGRGLVTSRATANGYGFGVVNHIVSKRATPTITIYAPFTGTAGQIGSFDSGADLGAVTVLQNSQDSFLLVNNSGGTIADGTPISFQYTANAEL